MPDLCETFRRQAGSVWSRMFKAPSLGMALSEETITETALYEIALVHQNLGDIDITIATKPAEKRHGADWEWWFIKGGRSVSFRVQAKRLFLDGTYRSLFKAPPNPYDQLDRLIHVANREGHIPLYCFFNFDQGVNYFDNWKGQCPHSYKGPSFWGCTLANPQEVRSKGSNKFVDLRPIMDPWHKLVCEHFYNRNSLPEAAIDFVKEAEGRGRRTAQIPQLREIPVSVRRLLEIKATRRAVVDDDINDYVDFTYYEESDREPPTDGEDAPEKEPQEDAPTGLIVFEDRRSD